MVIKNIQEQEELREDEERRRVERWMLERETAMLQ